MLRNCAVDIVEICNVYVGRMIIKAAKRIFNSDKICHSYTDLNFGVTFFGTQCIYYQNVQFFLGRETDILNFTAFKYFAQVDRTHTKLKIN